ncbi:UvrD-helicase domain-containing protein [Parafrigoribacterium mesophilum]|uniref:nuclease-related domain-containing DEAD/DEAH box helicase n=1 Tax=Parafrigoribacterium mesophilum TaxID=433646 RepID=UPI0031FE09B6
MSALAKSYLVEAERASAASGRFAAAAIAERRLATRLSPLTAHGYYLLPDRQWPGSKNAQLDLIIVGPSGVWIVDSKHWNNFSVAAGHIYRDQADVTDDVLRLADVANAAEESFVGIGLAPGEVRTLLVMAGHKGRLGEVGPVEVVGEEDVHLHLARRGKRLTTGQVERVLAVAMRYFPAYVGAQTETPVPIVTEPVLAELPDTLPDALLDDGALLSEAEVREMLTAADLAAPVEDWMTFLHPTQAALVRRSFNGPARIRGDAGTGKTVVGLHRAAYLARVHPHGRVLFTTFVKTLPAVMSNLLLRLAPDVAGRVEFVHVHGFAARVLRERGVVVNVDGRRASRMLDAAWMGLDVAQRARLTERAPAAPGDRPIEYWREEVESVIKGRGLTTFEEYADCARPGRLIRLNIDDRRAVWALFLAYDRSLRAAGIGDFQDQVLVAEAALRRKPEDGYAAVIVDEAQDLSLAMIRMLHGLVGDGPDAFTLIGDGQQSIYPGGYVLSEAGISLAGRGVVLDRNYRNTAEIQDFAARVIAGSSYTDIDDQALERPVVEHPAVETPVRHGAPPESAHFTTRADHDRALVGRIRRAVGPEALNLGDIAVLCGTNGEAAAIEKLLAQEHIRSLNLLNYVGLPVPAVKVGTVKRAKGLEFKLVIVPAATAPAHSGDERAARDIREHYVAATRARDALWIGAC